MQHIICYNNGMRVMIPCVVRMLNASQKTVEVQNEQHAHCVASLYSGRVQQYGSIWRIIVTAVIVVVTIP